MGTNGSVSPISAMGNVSKHSSKKNGYRNNSGFAMGTNGSVSPISAMGFSSKMPSTKSQKKISAKKIMHSNGRSLNDHMENIHGQLNEMQASSSPGLFGGGIFDFLSPKKPVQPVQPVQTLPHNQPPTLQEVVRDLQYRVKTLEDEVRPATIHGGYKATKKNLKALKKYKQGKSIGFTMRSSLKAKGLIPRANGTRRVSKKYRG
jgi:hypothetical protein